MSTISIIVVVYNQSVGSAPVVRAAIRSGLGIEIVVCDNSTCENDNLALSEKLGLCYVNMDGNKGLSAAYRAGIERCHGEVVCLFDDDTEVGKDYFVTVKDLDVSSRTWDVALPLVLSGDAVLSPCCFNGYRAHPFSGSSRVTDCSELSGINSGMVIKRSLLDNVQHDPGLFLDLIDHKFISDVKKAGGKVIYLQGPVLRQSYSYATDNADSALTRLLIFERDARHFYGDSLSQRLYCVGMLVGREIKMCLRYRTTRFLNPNKKKLERFSQ